MLRVAVGFIELYNSECCAEDAFLNRLDSDTVGWVGLAIEYWGGGFGGFVQGLGELAADGCPLVRFEVVVLEEEHQWGGPE